MSRSLIYMDILQLFESIEATNNFVNDVDEDIKKFFYHMYLKCKRNYLAINHLFEGPWKNSYIEAIPVIRILVESYFHLCYLMDEPDKEKVAQEYKILAERQSFKVAQDYDRYGGNLRKEENDFIQEHFTGKTKPMPPNYLQYVSELAIKTQNEYLFTRVYTQFSSYVHYNPTTLQLFGTTDDNGKFEFNKFVNNQELEQSLKMYTDGVFVMLFGRLAEYLNLTSLENEILDFNKKYKESYR